MEPHGCTAVAPSPFGDVPPPPKYGFVRRIGGKKYPNYAHRRQEVGGVPTGRGILILRGGVFRGVRIFP